MIRVSIEIGFSFKHEIGSAQPSIELPAGADVRAALRALAERHSAIADRLFDGRGEIHRYINTLVNGENVASRQGFATVLSDGDRLTILPPVGGG